MFLSAAGWKLNPVVGAVYSPEFYAGKDCSMIVPWPYFISVFFKTYQSAESVFGVRFAFFV